MATSTPATPAPPAPLDPPAPGPGTRPVTDALFHRFWPEPESLAGLRVVLVAAGVGVLAGGIMAFALPGLSWAVVLLARIRPAGALAGRRP